MSFIIVQQDYFVLEPEAYYEGHLLKRDVRVPCTADHDDLCRHYRYPSVAIYPSVNGRNAFRVDNGSRQPAKDLYTDRKV